MGFAFTDMVTGLASTRSIIRHACIHSIDASGFIQALDGDIRFYHSFNPLTSLQTHNSILDFHS